MERSYDRTTTLDWCRLADQGPFETLSCGERITSYSQEMRIILGAAAALTERIRIMPSLYVLPMHDAVWAAKEIATLDVLSAGRTSVTVGVGGRPQDYRAVGASFERRHERMDQQVETMRRIWAGEPPFEGADPVGPTPVQPGGPPLFAGAMGPKAIRRAAAWADGLYGFSTHADAGVVKQQFALAREAWDAAGRSRAPKLMNGFWFSLADDAESKLRHYVYEYLKIAGDTVARGAARSIAAYSPDVILAAMDAFEAEGCEELYLVPGTLETSEIERVAALIEKRG
jgi:alkanesulfonate monooxygenase SsuD/methylene tetrahydromethanopterin reductase-like flavin-dependent oxidoreductase (luciferase family)